MASPSWIDYASLTVGFVGVAIGMWQLRTARSARKAETEARAELRSVMIEQRVSQLSAALAILQNKLVENSISSRDQISILIPSFAELKAFGGDLFADKELEKLGHDRKALIDLHQSLLEDEIALPTWNTARATCVYLQETLKEIYGRLERERISKVNRG